MSKRSRNDTTPRASRNNNPVAKYAGKFNKAVAFRDRTRYARRPKHKALEPFPMQVRAISGASGKVPGARMLARPVKAAT